MKTPNAKNRSVFALFPTACDYDKLNGYFRKLRNAKIEVLQTQGGFGENLLIRKVLRPNQQRTQSKMGSFETAISEMKQMVQNTLMRVMGIISGCSEGQSNTMKFREIGELANLERNLENWKEEKVTLKAARDWLNSKRKMFYVNIRNIRTVSKEIEDRNKRMANDLE